ncbi:MAG: T9SS type A sorting domain-containing protein [Saprospiraceae bacterium]
MKKLTLLFIICCLGLTLSAQTWDGGGDGHSWNDAMNWDNDQVPGTTDLVEITTTTTIDGTAPNAIGRLKIGGGNKTVTLDLDLSINDGTIAEHGIIIGNKTSLIIGTNISVRTITVNVPNNKDAVAVFGNVSDATDVAELMVEAGNTLNIVAGDDGFNMASTNGAFQVTNNGTITIAGVDNNGFNFQDGILINNGTITINGTTANKGIRYEADADSLVNNGTITITDVSDDGIEIAATDFINNGIINVTVVSTATASNNGLLVSTGGTFVNSQIGTLNVDGGMSTNARGIVVADGTFDNSGLVTTTGGNVGSAIRLDGGMTTNAACAIIDGTNGTRINANGGTLVNNGLLKSSHTGSGIFLGNASTANVTNNAFFSYDNSNQFATGAGGMITDNGLSAKTDSLSVDANGTCTIDLGIDLATDLYADAAGTTLIGTTDATGNLTFPTGIFAIAGLQTLYTCYGNEFIVEVSNVSGDCATVIPTIDSVNVTFTVNTNKPNFTVDAAGIFLAGGGNFGVPGDNPMLDIDNDGVYEITVRVPEGFSSFYTFTNGACADWSCKEDLTGLPCGDPNNHNDRTLPAVYSDTTLSTCFEECSTDGSCATNTTRLINDETLFSVAPTLVNDYTIITFGETAAYSTKTLRVLNAVGQTMTIENIDNTNTYGLNTNDFPAGMYFINIQTEDKMATKRIVVSK